MAIYHLKVLKGGGYHVWAEMRKGRSVEVTAKWFAADKEALRRQTQNLALLVKDARAGKAQFRGAQVNRGEETT